MQSAGGEEATRGGAPAAGQSNKLQLPKKSPQGAAPNDSRAPNSGEDSDSGLARARASDASCSGSDNGPTNYAVDDDDDDNDSMSDEQVRYGYVVGAHRWAEGRRASERESARRRQ